jgi:beta-galactosidase
MPKLSRRRFLQTVAVATAAAQLAPKLHAAAPSSTAHPYPENGTLIPDEGWHLWIDDKAAWQNDDIFLPEEM